MPTTLANGVRLNYEVDGAGEPLVLVHGSWLDLFSWQPIVPHLAGDFETIRYDRRGHGRSETTATQGSLREDAEDLAALIEALGAGPAHVVGNSFGGTVALTFAALRPDLLRTLAVHEPPLFGLVRDDPVAAPVWDEVARRTAAIFERFECGDDEGGARLFVDTIAFRPGTWDQEFRRGLRRMFVRNAATFVDEYRSPDFFDLDGEALGQLDAPVLITTGSESGIYFHRMAENLERLIPTARRLELEGAGHVPHRDQPERYAGLLAELARRAPQPV
jgi:pimeloyl-ACP methyl ester carboxylesterase